MQKTSTLKIIGAIITIAIAFSLSLANYQISEQAKMNNVSGDHGSGGLSGKYDLNWLGRDATLSEVKTAVGLSQPTYLPSGTSSPQIKIHESGFLAALIYTNPNLKRIIGYEQDVQIVILAEKDGTSFADFLNEKQPTATVTMTKDGREEVRTVDIPVTQPNMNRPSTEVSVAGNLGYGHEPLDTSKLQDSGRVHWWGKDGIHYQILANLPLQELQK
jgi:hypothetical protein